jgi:membrane-associated phospholipid phosphatase
VTLLCIAAVGLLVRLDLAIMHRLEEYPRLRAHGVFDLLRQLAEFWPQTLLGAAVLLFDRRGVLIACHLALASYIGFNAAQLGKCLVVRERPYRITDLASRPWHAGWHGVSLEVRRRSGLSAFPSGHSTAAFTAATVLAWFYPRLRAPVFALAAGAACSRFVENWHWPSDCLAGALIGYGSGWLSLRARKLSQPRNWLVRRSKSRA